MMLVCLSLRNFCLSTPMIKFLISTFLHFRTPFIVPEYFAKFHSITKYSARFLDLYFCESTAAIVPIIG